MKTLPVVVLLAFVTFGCISTRVSVTSERLAARTPPEAIAIVQSGPQLPPFDAIATIQATHSAIRGTKASIDALRLEASKLGADAILDLTWAGRKGQFVLTPDGGGYAGTPGTAVMGTAIRWHDKAQGDALSAPRSLP